MPGLAGAGAFVFTEPFGGQPERPDAITHPQVYSGLGGELVDLTVCLDRSVNASLTAQAEPAVVKAVDTFNRGRSLGANNYALNAATDIASGFDFESVLLHELGHCQGLNHPNHASESGFSDPQANGTKSLRGPNGGFDQGAGPDGIHGSRDDARGDDVNLHWYIRGQNNPGLFLQRADASTMARTLGFLPSGHTFAANADRTVMNALGFANSEAVMQQGTPPREAKRHLHHSDLMTLRLARSGLDRSQGTADDYRYRLRYVGRLSNPSNSVCNIRIRIDNSTGFAVCGVSGVGIGGNAFRITEAQIAMNSSVNWYYSPGPNTVTQITSTSPSPSAPGQAYSANVRVTKASGISISGNPQGTVEVDDGLGGQCSFNLASAANGLGSCQLPGSAAGTRSLTARFFGIGGSDYSEGTASHSVQSAPQATLTSITARNPISTVVGQPYQVSVSVTAVGATPTGSVTVSDGAQSCSAALVGGSMSCSLSSLSAGLRSLAASYQPSGNFLASSGSANHVVGAASTSTTIQAIAPQPSGFAAPLEVTFSVQAQAPSSAIPIGTVTVSASDGPESCTASVAQGRCSLALLGLGARTLTARFAATPDFLSSSDSRTQTVVQAGTTTQITAINPSPARVGQSYVVAVNVSNPHLQPPGTVSVSDGAGSCEVTLVGGAGSCGLISLQAGSRSLIASYVGTPEFAASSGSAAQGVQPAATRVEWLGNQPNPSAPDAPVRVFFQVLPLAPGGGQPAGTVNISAGPAEACSVPVAQGSCLLPLGAAGPRSLQLDYAGSPDHLPSSASGRQAVVEGLLFADGFEAAPGD
ncbi:MAG: Ig-like domain repeat protein [Aquimonas sp.]|nr:Ig-like domain repeat protein [Aquimonas sp.]